MNRSTNLTYLFLVLLAAAACSGGNKKLAVSGACSLDSDCKDPLVCRFATCHQQCKETRDCPSGQRCLRVGDIGVCQQEQEATCSAMQTCKGGLACGADNICRAPCTTVAMCMNNQLCVNNTCADTTEAARLTDGGLGGGDGSAPGTDGSSSAGKDGPAVIGADGGAGADVPVGGGDATGGSTGDGGRGVSDGAGTGGKLDAPTPLSGLPQTQFLSIAEGDSNPKFVSGIGVRTEKQILTFNAYRGPDPTSSADAGTANFNYVYVQSFDVATAKSSGPAQPLFPAKAGQEPQNGYPLNLLAASVSPGGQIALLYYGGNIGAASVGGMWAAFLDSAPADAGGAPAGLQVVRQVQLEVSYLYSQPQAIWSAKYGAFVFSWKYGSDTGSIKVRKFLSDGRSAGGDSESLPTTEANNSTYFGNFGTIAASRELFGVTYLSGTGSRPCMTVLDGKGNQVGQTFVLQETPAVAKWVTAAGTSAGFVTFYDQGGVAATLVPVAADGSVAAPTWADAGTSLQSFHFTGTKTAFAARAVNDDVGGAGGVGLVLLYDDGVAFAYVYEDGKNHVGPGSVWSHSRNTSDIINVSNFGGSFAISLWSATDKMTSVAISSAP